MAGIYIKNMSMPQGDQLVVVTSDGVALLIDKEFTMLERSKVIPVPDHGDLIDRDAARGSIKPWVPDDERNGCTFDTVKKLMYTMLDRAPTVIPASKEEAK